MITLDKTILDKQIEVYLEWGRRHNTSGSGFMDKDWLRFFAKTCTKIDVTDITDHDLEFFYEKVYHVARTPTENAHAHKAVRGLLRFYGARGKNHATRVKRGRPPQLDQISRVKNYRQMGLKLKEIKQLVGKDMGQISRWLKQSYPQKND